MSSLVDELPVDKLPVTGYLLPGSWKQVAGNRKPVTGNR